MFESIAQKNVYEFARQIVWRVLDSESFTVRCIKLTIRNRTFFLAKNAQLVAGEGL